MRLGFRRTPLDLIIAAALSLSILPQVLLGVGGPFRYLLALALVFLLPGYAMAAVLFPEDGEIDWIRRIALSVGLSIASVALLGLLLDLTPVGLNVATVVGSLLLLSLGTSALAWWRRLRVSEPRRLSLSIDLALPLWRDLRFADRLLAIGVAIALTSGVGVVAFGLANPPSPDRFTELYLLDAGGGVLNYTLSLNTTEGGSVVVGIHNVEGMPVNYTVVVLLASLETVYNATTGRNETVPGNSTFLDSFAVEVASGGRAEEPFPFSIPIQGEYLLEFRLYMGPPQGPPYRYVDLHVRVS